MEVLIKQFEELNKEELYDLLALRASVFVVEQNCAYQDLDGKDRQAVHVMGLVDNSMAAYTRLFAPGQYYKEATIGRVVVDKKFRSSGLGRKIMEATIEAASTLFEGQDIRISAQSYLREFYNSMAFKAEGEEYLEDGIPHISMVLHRP